MARGLEGESPASAGIRRPDQARKRRAKDHVAAGRRRRVRPDKRRGGDDDDVPRLEGIGGRIGLVAKETGSQAAAADVIGDEIGVEGADADGGRRQVDFEAPAEKTEGRTAHRFRIPNSSPSHQGEYGDRVARAELPAPSAPGGRVFSVDHDDDMGMESGRLTGLPGGENLVPSGGGIPQPFQKTTQGRSLLELENPFLSAERLTERGEKPDPHGHGRPDGFFHGRNPAGRTRTRISGSREGGSGTTATAIPAGQRF